MYERKDKLILVIMSYRKHRTDYKIVITANTFEIYASCPMKADEKRIYADIKRILEDFKNYVVSKGKKIIVEKITFSKGYDISDEEYKRKLSGKTVDTKQNGVGISLRYYNREIAPLIIYSYLQDIADKELFIENYAKYIDKLASVIEEE